MTTRKPTAADALKIRTLVLEKIRKRLQAKVAPALLDSVGANVIWDAVTEQVAVQVHYDLFGRQVSEAVLASERVPATWLDAVKERFLRGRFFRRWPYLDRLTSPHYRTIPTLVKHYHVCPHVNVRYDQFPGNLHISFLSDS